VVLLVNPHLPLPLPEVQREPVGERHREEVAQPETEVGYIEVQEAVRDRIDRIVLVQTVDFGLYTVGFGSELDSVVAQDLVGNFEAVDIPEEDRREVDPGAESWRIEGKVVLRV